MPLERAVWYLAPFWAGVHFNVVGTYQYQIALNTAEPFLFKLSAKIPIDRLIGSDLQRSGAVTALVIISIVIAVLVVNQFLVIRKTGVLLYYLSRYIVAVIAVVILASLPTLTFRLHHVSL
jgi:hypothetical protein